MLKQWPTFRMPFAKFTLAYPQGEVFLNDYRTPTGKMARVETVKARPYWIIWAHFFEKTDINRATPLHAVNGTH